jgi:hypothetical protein
VLDAVLLIGMGKGINAVDRGLTPLPTSPRLRLDDLVDREAVDELGAVIGQNRVGRVGQGHDEGTEGLN